MKQKSKTFQNLIKLVFSVIFSKWDTVLFSSVLNATQSLRLYSVIFNHLPSLLLRISTFDTKIQLVLRSKHSSTSDIEAALHRYTDIYSGKSLQLGRKGVNPRNVAKSQRLNWTRVQRNKMFLLIPNLVYSAHLYEAYASNKSCAIIHRFTVHEV